MQLPHSVKNYIEDRAQTVPFAILEAAALELSAHYRAARESFTVPLRAQHKAVAYLATRMPATYAVAVTVLSEIAVHIPAVKSILDLGAGTGAASLAVQKVFGEETALTLLDSDSAFFAEAKQLLVGSTFIQTDLPNRTEFPESDLVIASYTLGELSDATCKQVVQRAWAASRLGIVIIEPGTTKGWENVLAVRSQLLSLGAYLVAPCPHSQECSMVKPDWCHFSQRVERSSMHRKLKQGTMGYEDEKYSFVVFSRQPVSAATGRIVRRPVYHPGLVELEVCQVEGIEKMRVTKKNKAQYRAARDVQWGSAWVVSGN